MKNLVIFGTRQIAKVCAYYFRHDSDYRIVGYTVDGAFLDNYQFDGLPVVPFEDVAKRFAPAEHDMFVAIGYGKMNRLRAEKFAAAKSLGYTLARYVSSRAFTWPGLAVGENTFVMEANVIQPVRIHRLGHDHLVRQSHRPSRHDRRSLLSRFAHRRVGQRRDRRSLLRRGQRDLARRDQDRATLSARRRGAG
jgi:hypothetical protein